MGKFVISQEEIYFESNQEANHNMEINTYHQKIVQNYHYPQSSLTQACHAIISSIPLNKCPPKGYHT